MTPRRAITRRQDAPKRKRFSEREVIETLWHQGVVVKCYRCGKALHPFAQDPEMPPLEAIEREHLHEVELGGEDKPHNCRYSHKACHAKVTNGTPATSAGSSKHRIAKCKRLAKQTFQKKEPGTKRVTKWTGRTKGFQKRPEGHKYNWSWK